VAGLTAGKKSFQSKKDGRLLWNYRVKRKNREEDREDPRKLVSGMEAKGRAVGV